MSSVQKGFSLVEGLVLAAVVVIAGSLGLVAWNTFMQPSEVATSSPTSDQQTAEVITTKSDLETVEKELDALDFEDEDAIQAEAQAEL